MGKIGERDGRIPRGRSPAEALLLLDLALALPWLALLAWLLR